MKKINLIWQLSAVMIIISLLITGCPGKVVVEGGVVRITEIEINQKCILQLKITISQDGKSVTTFGVVQNGEVEAGDIQSMNLLKPVTIRVEVANASIGCEPLAPGMVFEFSGTMTREGPGKFSVKFSDFEKK